MNMNIYENYSEAEMLEDEIQMLQEEENLNRLKCMEARAEAEENNVFERKYFLENNIEKAREFREKAREARAEARFLEAKADIIQKKIDLIKEI